MEKCACSVATSINEHAPVTSGVSNFWVISYYRCHWQVEHFFYRLSQRKMKTKCNEEKKGPSRSQKQFIKLIIIVKKLNIGVFNHTGRIYYRLPFRMVLLNDASSLQRWTAIICKKKKKTCCISTKFVKPINKIYMQNINNVKFPFWRISKKWLIYTHKKKEINSTTKKISINARYRAQTILATYVCVYFFFILVKSNGFIR